MSQNNIGKHKLITDLRNKTVIGPNNDVIAALNPTNLGIFTPHSVIGTDIAVGLTQEDLNETDNNFDFDTSGDTLTLTSTSNNDINGGTGIQSILLLGLDTNWNKINETVIMNGTTGVTTTNTFLRLNSYVISSYGSNNASVGIISITGDGFTWGKILANSLYSGNLGRYSTAINEKFVIQSFVWTTPQNGDFQLFFYNRVSPFPLIQTTQYFIHSNSQLIFGVPFTLPEKSDILFKVLRESGGGGSQSITAVMQGWLCNTTDLLNYY
jgi:hypothetical protein